MIFFVKWGIFEEKMCGFGLNEGFPKRNCDFCGEIEGFSFLFLFLLLLLLVFFLIENV